jgi:hypothetical protein
MFDFFGLKKTRAKLTELEFVLEKQRADIKTLEKVIDRLRIALENEVSKNLQTEPKSPKKKAVLETPPQAVASPAYELETPPQAVASPAYKPVRSSSTSTTPDSSNMMTGIILGSLLSDNHKHSHSAPLVSSDTYSSSSSYDSSSDSGSSSSSSD